MELRKLIRQRVTAGEKRMAVARELATRFGISTSAVTWYMRQDLTSGSRWLAPAAASSDVKRRSIGSPGTGAGLEKLKREFDRLLERDLEIRKAHVWNLARITELGRRVSRLLRGKPRLLKPLRPRPLKSGQEVQSFGSRLRELRLASGLTLEEVARGARTNKGYLSSIERGRLPAPSGRFVGRIARFFSVDRRELLRMAYFEKAPAELMQDLIRAFWPR